MSCFTGTLEHQARTPEIPGYGDALEIAEPGAFTRLAIAMGTRRFTLDHQTRFTGYSKKRSALGFL